MRLTPLVLCLGLAASTLPVAVVGQRPDDQIAPQSVAFQRKFFDRYLKGLDNGWEKEPRVEVVIRKQ